MYKFLIGPLDKSHRMCIVVQFTKSGSIGSLLEMVRIELEVPRIQSKANSHSQSVITHIPASLMIHGFGEHNHTRLLLSDASKKAPVTAQQSLVVITICSAAEVQESIHEHYVCLRAV